MRDIWDEVKLPFVFAMAQTACVVAIVAGAVWVTMPLPGWAQAVCLAVLVPVLVLACVFSTVLAVDWWDS